MALKVYKAGNAIAHENTGGSLRVHLQEGHVYYWPLGTLYFKENTSDNTFSIFRTNQNKEISIATELTSSDILNEEGVRVGSDSETIDYLNNIFQLFPNEATLQEMGLFSEMMTSDKTAAGLLEDVLEELKLIKMHLSIMTEANLEL